MTVVSSIDLSANWGPPPSQGNRPTCLAFTASELNRNLSGFAVADLPNQHHIRILTQNGSQTASKCHIYLGVYLRLADTLEFILDRVFDRHDIAFAGIEAAQCGIEGGALTRPCRTGDKDNAMWPLDQFIDLPPIR